MNSVLETHVNVRRKHAYNPRRKMCVNDSDSECITVEYDDVVFVYPSRKQQQQKTQRKFKASRTL